ncbi:ATP-dependent RNA helicase HrpB [Geobacter sp. OR-1]|uniref:ATP-dependent helicase HrpB n=1 Tax=Geobacter sp. OR-1 TaxID=1266765 RepID=UPI0005430640|nr:ATP-dependent helicase HrpB [Geobacter sp. OR-1]GAM10825.1 ATP-dependent RNA helicase HrpB [Geobacter sp. OR-1]
MHPLPVDSVIPELLYSLESATGAVLQAPPGSGKTSRVPLALLNSSLGAAGRILMLEPRRLAAVNAASWLAKSIGERVGETVGYSIRFDRKVSPRTRVEVLTEGLLTRRLQADPTLDGISTVIFDEFHERSLHADTALALCLDVQKTIRPDLKIVVMSATLECGPVSGLLGDVPVVSCAGVSHPVDIRYLGDPAGEIAAAAAGGVKRALAETSGDLLVFLPGSAEIRRCGLMLADSSPGDILISHLYGDLPFEDQERALLPGNKRKVVLATNIAETSLTIEGVSVVIDAGLSRTVRFDPATGLNRIQTVRESAASAAQRAGRSGRLGPGICYRLWSAATNATLVPYGQPEIRVVDLAPLALELANWGVADPAALSWLDPPSTGGMEEARSLLQMLGALDAGHRITNRGRRMAMLPLHPRLSSMVLEGEALGAAPIACDLAALISEKEILRRDYLMNRPSNSCDYTDRLELLDEWRSGSGLSGVLDTNACRQVDRVSGRLKRLVNSGRDDQAPMLDLVPLLLLQGFPDRCAMQREDRSDRYLLANGTGGRLGPGSSLHDRQFIVAVEILGSPGKEGVIHGASGVTGDQIRRQFSEQIAIERKTSWDRESGRVITTAEECFGALRLSIRSCASKDEEVVNALLGAINEDPELGMLPWTDGARQFQARLAFINRVAGDKSLPDLSNDALSSRLAEWLSPALSGMKSASDLKRLDMLGLLQSQLSWEQLRLLDEGAPTHITVPSGSRLRLDYSGGEPFVAVKLQEMFGLAETPTIAWGRVPIILHLLSPAQRPMQVTRDLRSFWDKTYPQVKKELKGRYPKHPWPDDPWSAVPTRKTVRAKSA